MQPSSLIQTAKQTPSTNVVKDEKALFIRQALSKALPTILSDATSEISFRLGEHRLESLRENIISQRLRSIVQTWRNELEHRIVRSQIIKTRCKNSVWKKKTYFFLSWKRNFYIRSSAKRWHARLVFQADIAAKERLFAAWNFVQRQYRRLLWIVERRSLYSLRCVLLSWSDLKCRNRHKKLLVGRATSSRMMRQARCCLHGMLDVARSSISFFNLTILVSKVRRYDAAPAFRNWKDRTAQLKSHVVFASKLKSLHIINTQNRYLLKWLIILKQGRRLRGLEASFSRLTAERSALLVFAYWSSKVRHLRWIQHSEETVTKKLNCRLCFSVLKMFTYYLGMRHKMSVAIDRIVLRRSRIICYETFQIFFNVMLARRRRSRALRMRDLFFINRFYRYMRDWASAAKRAQRFRKLTKQLVRTCNKSFLSLQIHMDGWKRRASQYWIAWRKVTAL